MADRPELTTVHCARATPALLRECADIAPPDEFGRKLPAYVHLHRAVQVYHAKLKRTAGLKA